MNAAEPAVALVVAAGSGVRMGGEVPKALRLIAGEPLLVHALRNLAAGGVTAAVVVVRRGDEAAMTEAVARVPEVQVQLVAGGAQRQDSVRAGLALAGGARIVLVHDAARPLVDPGTIGRVIEAVRTGSPAVVPVVPVVDSIRQVDRDGASSRSLDRSQLRAVQTPQGFDREVLDRAHRHVTEHGIAVTDDAGACEALGVPISMVAGSATGMKITHPHDLVVAEQLLVDRCADPKKGL